MLRWVKQFTYLGSIVCSNRNLDAEISARVAKANAIFGRLLRPIFHKPQISRLAKASIYSSSVSSVVLHSSETSPLTQSQMMKIDAVQTKHLRKIEHVRWLDRVRNTDILRSFKLPPLSEQLESCWLRCYGIYFAYPLKQQSDLYWTSIQLQTAGNAPEVEHVQDRRISSMIDLQRGALTPAKRLPSPKTDHSGDD